MTLHTPTKPRNSLITVYSIPLVRLLSLYWFSHCWEYNHDDIIFALSTVRSPMPGIVSDTQNTFGIANFS